MVQSVKQKQTVTVLVAYRWLEINSPTDLPKADILLIIIFAFNYVVSKL